MIEYSGFVSELIRLALQEDLGFGDITADLSIPNDAKASASILVKEDGIIAGLPLINRIFKEAGSDISFQLHVDEGAEVIAGTVVASGVGDTKTLLSLERTILNFLQRVSGVATKARSLATDAQGLILLDTRKTLPGWRTLDKYGVRVGGASNHRFSLGDLILVKNNHIDAGGGVKKTLTRIVEQKPPYIRLEVEVRTEKELNEVLQFKPDIVMLDNMSDDAIAQSMKLIKKRKTRPFVEVSGGVTKERFKKLRSLGVNAVSMGALTTDVKNLDISMRLKKSN